MLNLNVRRNFKSIGLQLARQSIVTLSIFLTVANQVFAAPQSPQGFTSNRISQELHIGVDSEGINPAVKVAVESLEFDSSDESTQKMVDIIAEKSHQKKASVLLSTDNVNLVTAMAESNDVNIDNVITMPIDNETLAKPKSKYGQLVKNFVQNRVQGVRDDKFGFMVVTYTTATDVLIWIHNTELSEFARTGNAIYTVILSVIFSLNKDTWTHVARPIQKFFRGILKPADASPTNAKEMLSRFLGNLSLTMVVVGLRIPLVSMDAIIEKGLHLNYFSMPLLLAVVSTASIFTWSEFGAAIDQKIMPLSKFVYRRSSEVRSVIVGTFATSAALLHPAEYGITPWMTMVGVGATGAVLYFNGERIKNWVENRRELKPLKDWLEKGSSLQKEKAPLIKALRCESLFAG